MPGSPKSPKATLIERKRTANASFDRATPIEIHRTSAKVVTLTLATVKHKTQGPRMTATLGQFDPRQPQDDGVCIRLDEDDVDVLAEVLRRAAPVMTANEDGRYVVTPVNAEMTRASIEALISALSGDPKMFEALAADDGLYRLQEAVSHLGRLAALKRSISELEEAIARKESSESFYQKWCEKNSWAFGFTYMSADDLHAISRSDKVDLLLQRLFGGYRDLVELKTPTTKVLERVRHFYTLSKQASEALGQALHYMSRLQHAAYYQGGMQDASHIRAHRPRAIIVVGSSDGWNQEMKQAWQEHNAALTDVQLWTFEELIECGRRAISVLGG